MKQLPLTLLLLICSSIAAHDCLSQDSGTKITAKASANYHNRDCVGGVGFCNGAVDIVLNEAGTTTIEKLPENIVQFSVPSSSLTDAQILALFGVARNSIVPNRMYRFEQNVDIELSQAILTALEIDPSYSVIGQQFYSMILNGGVINITFFLSQA